MDANVLGVVAKVLGVVVRVGENGVIPTGWEKPTPPF